MTMDRFEETRRGGRLAELADVGAGDEGASPTHQDHSFYFGVLIGRRKTFDQALTNALAQGIDWRIVDYK